MTEDGIKIHITERYRKEIIKEALNKQRKKIIEDLIFVEGGALYDLQTTLNRLRKRREKWEKRVI